MGAAAGGRFDITILPGRPRFCAEFTNGAGSGGEGQELAGMKEFYSMGTQEGGRTLRRRKSILRTKRASREIVW